MKRFVALAAAFIVLAGALTTVVGFGADAQEGDRCTFAMNVSSSETATARAEVSVVGRQVTVDIRRATPHTLYTVWTDFRNRATLSHPDDYPFAAGAEERGVSPLFPTTAGVTSGMGLDRNGIITSGAGNGVLTTDLDYELLTPGDSPVVGSGLATQGLNYVGGGWLRVYPQDTAVQASLQVTDGRTGLPLVHRATAQGITIVRHPDQVTHGHTPGVNGVDRSSAFNGDFPSYCFGDFDILFSTRADRSNPQRLDGAKLDEDNRYAIYLTPITDRDSINRVVWILDGRWVKRENFSPYDLAGTNDGRAGRRSLPEGSGDLLAIITFDDDSKATARARYDVED